MTGANTTMNIRRLSNNLFFLTTLMAAFVTTSYSQDRNWQPVSPADLQSNQSVVEPNADAEAIFWEVRVDDSSTSETSLRHYVRVKIYTEKGREDFSRKDVYFTKGMKIRDIDARVTKPDGSVIYLKKEDVFEREVVRASGLKIKAKTFALPGIEVGSVVEYRYRETIDDGSANMALLFQREIPIRRVTYWIKPFAGTLGMNFEPFNTDARFEKDKDGFHRASMENVKAIPNEPNMPPEDDIKSWIYIYYVSDPPKNKAEYWKRIGANVHNRSKDQLKPNNEIKSATESLIAGAADDTEKLRRIYNYVKTQIRNLSYMDNVSETEKKKGQEAKTASDVFKNRFAYPIDINLLFGAMARAAGFDARLAITGDREEMTFNLNTPQVRLMGSAQIIAINQGGKWNFYSPGAYFVPFGSLPWYTEGQPALIGDDKNLVYADIPPSPPAVSKETRTGKFSLSDDGTLKGTGKIVFSGHPAAIRKNSMRTMSGSEREESVKSLVRSYTTGNATVDKISIEGMDNPDAPLAFTFELEAPGYASRTGRRIFFQPSVFERNAKPRFTAQNRTTDIVFRYPFAHEDDITIETPKGFKLEAADAPNSIRDQQGIGNHEVNILVIDGGEQVKLTRKFSFGNGGFLLFPAQSYSAIKQMFDAFNKADIHPLTLRQE